MLPADSLCIIAMLLGFVKGFGGNISNFAREKRAYCGRWWDILQGRGCEDPSAPAMPPLRMTHFGGHRAKIRAKIPPLAALGRNDRRGRENRPLQEGRIATAAKPLRNDRERNDTERAQKWDDDHRGR